VDPDSVIHDENGFSSKFDSELNISFEDLAGRLEGTGGPVSITATVDLTLAEGTFGVHIADIEIDTETGKTDIIRYTVAQDVGKAIHPAYVEGQLQGGAAQGVGWALNEEYFMDADGAMVNSSFLDYRMPTSLDLPYIETILVEVENPLHPFGVKGVGEVTIAPPIGTIANAINDALGVRLRHAPMKPSRILEGIGVI
jgi:CO/xanthine dehydrogenase Mo-binding subunit